MTWTSPTVSSNKQKLITDKPKRKFKTYKLRTLVTEQLNARIRIMGREPKKMNMEY